CGGIVFRWNLELCAGSVAEAIFHANAPENARVWRAAKDHAGNGECGIVRVSIFHLQRHRGEKEPVLLVGRFDLVVDGLDLGVGIWDALIAGRALPVAKELGDELTHLLRIELTADYDFTLSRPIELLIERAHFIERDFLVV